MKITENKIKQLESKLNYKFKRKELLIKALTHPSYVFENRFIDKNESNEKMEFLGDSILGFLVGKLVYESFRDEEEGILSKIKSYWVSAAILSQLGSEVGVKDALILGKGEEKRGGRNNPKNIANAFEALIASIYFDGGIKSAERVIKRIFKNRIVKEAKKVINFDYKSRFQEICQEKFKEKPYYYTVKREEHFVSKAIFKGKVMGTGIGTNKKNAEQEAAKDALEKEIDIESEV